MSHIATYWAIANHTIAILNILAECFLFYRFVKPFMKAKAFCLHAAFILLSKFWITQNITYICSIQNHSINSMDFATTFFVVLAIIGVGMVLWIKTNSGKKWLSNL